MKMGGKQTNKKEPERGQVRHIRWKLVLTDGVGKLDIHMQKHEVGPLPSTLEKRTKTWLKI